MCSSDLDHPNGSGRQCLNITIGVDTGDKATRVHLDGPVDRCALLLEGRTAGLHVSHGSPGPNVANSAVIFHAAAPAGDTEFRPAIDKWQWNQQQGTLSPCANTALVMGLVSDDDNKYVGLVHRGSPTEFKFAIV